MKVAVPHFYVHLSMYHKSSQASQGFYSNLNANCLLPLIVARWLLKLSTRWQSSVNYQFVIRHWFQHRTEVGINNFLCFCLFVINPTFYLCFWNNYNAILNVSFFTLLIRVPA
jgi:hypothetical protein